MHQRLGRRETKLQEENVYEIILGPNDIEAMVSTASEICKTADFGFCTPTPLSGDRLTIFKCYPAEKRNVRLEVSRCADDAPALGKSLSVAPNDKTGSRLTLDTRRSATR